MRRNLTKRNKNFLSRRYSKYHNGRYSFNATITYSFYGNETTPRVSVHWGWRVSLTPYRDLFLGLDEIVGMFNEDSPN